MPELAANTTAVQSADIVVEMDTPVTIWLKDADGGALPDYVRVYVEIKNSGGNYTTVGVLDMNNTAKVIVAKGTYRIRRPAYGVAVGVEWTQ